MLLIPLLLFIITANSEDLDDCPTPASNLRDKCIYYNADSVFAKNKCFIIDQLYSTNPNVSRCNHLHGFNGKMANNDAEVLKYLELRNYIKSGETLITRETKGESYTTEARVLCEYSDIFSCEDGYRLHGIHCYKVIRKETYWAEALRTCQQQGTTLAVPHNDKDSQFIASVVSKENILNDNDNSFFWVGMFVKEHKHLKFVDQTTPNYFRWLPIGHKRLLTKAYNTPNTVIAVGSSASNKGNVGQFGYYQVINGNFHRLPFLCQKLANGEYGPIYYPKRD